MLALIGTLLGGLGLFLLAVGLMTDGLKQATGSALRQILAKWTSSEIKGIGAGFLMTALVQSSSAVTLATVGFVNAGLLTMRQALGVVYGANVGTTVTAWLVAIIGFKLDIQAFALPMIGIGMLLRLLKPDSSAGAYGIALVGFGMFFVGIDTLKTAFEGLALTIDLSSLTADGIRGVLLFLLAGIVMTVITQSSSASIALTIAAASSGVIGPYAAAAMVIGANVGTTSTAIFASIGTTANSRRVALAQVIFNVGTGLIALILLPLMFLLIDFLLQVFMFSANIGVTLALFHTTFNILGVLLILPFNNRLVTFLEKRFVSRADTESLPRYLDKTLTATPVLAVNTLVLELESIAERVTTIMQNTFNPTIQRTELHRQINIVRKLSEEVSRFTVTLSRSTLSAETTQHLATVLRIDQYLLSCINQIDTIYNLRQQLNDGELDPVHDDLEGFKQTILSYLTITHTQTEWQEPDFDDALLTLKSEHDTLKAQLLMAATTQTIPVDDMLHSIEYVAEQLNMMQQWFKALKYLQQMHSDTDITNKLEPLEITAKDDAPNMDETDVVFEGEATK